MATELAKAYVQILPTTKGIKSELTKQLGGEAGEAGKSAGDSFVSKMKGVIAAAGIGAVVTKTIKDSIDAGAALQQSYVGGLETLYGDAAEAAREYARQAASAGISMNDYAEQAVSFGASLKAAFDGDTAKAAEAANTAIMDMADNAAKMGTPLESIQNAYQGFAKGNYTMLDNLKLGFGGTRSEMERLLKTAENSPKNVLGKSFDIDNLGDVYEAIHIIQEGLDLTGVAAQEASETLSGSLGAMQASWQNLLAVVATGEGNTYDAIDTLFNSIGNFVGNNLIPMVGRIVEHIPQIIGNVIYALGDAMSSAAKGSGAFLEAGTSIVADLLDVVLMSAGNFAAGAWELLTSFGNALISFDWSGFASNLINLLQGSISESAYSMFGDYDADIITSLISGIMTKLPDLWQSAYEIISNLAKGIFENLPNIIASAAEIIAKIVYTIGQHLPDILQKGLEIIGNIVTGIISAIPKVISAIPQIISAIKNAFSNYDWKSIGTNIIDGIKNGILNAAGSIAEAAKEAAHKALSAAKEFLGIASPSKVMRDQVGKWIPEGIAVGITNNTDSITSAMNDVANETANRFNASIPMVDSMMYNNTNNNANDTSVMGILSEYLPKLANRQIVLDSGVMVGALAPGMDNTMGRLSSYKERYN